MRKTADYHDEFDWAPAAMPVPQFETMVPRARRLDPLTVTWRGHLQRFEPAERLVFGQRTHVVSPITLWPPTTDADHPFPRDGWAADIRVESVGFLQGKGATPQQALDALARELPDFPMVRGGSC